MRGSRPPMGGVGSGEGGGILGTSFLYRPSLYPRLRSRPQALRFAPVPTAFTAGVQGRPRHRRSPPRAPVPPRQRPRPFSQHHHLQRLGVHAAVKRRSLQGLHLPSVSTSLPAKRSALGGGAPVLGTSSAACTQDGTLACFWPSLHPRWGQGKLQAVPKLGVSPWRDAPSRLLDLGK
jgi:hypothetical protein